MPVNESLDLNQVRAVLDQSGEPWRISYTSMTALTEAERVRRLGVPPTPGLDVDRLEEAKDERAAMVRSAVAESVGAPVAFDLRNVNGVDFTTPVKDQLSCGSCVSFATVAAMEHVRRFTTGTSGLAIDLSEAHLFYTHGRNAGATCSSGWWPDQACNASRDIGVTFEDYFPYTPGDQDSSRLNSDWPNRLAKITAWKLLNNNAAEMKRYISTYGSIGACFDVYQDFFSYGGGIYRHLTGAYAGGHCVCLVGYDDAQGCWIAKNSWGNGWGAGGFFRIAYGECRIEGYQTVGIEGVNVRAWLPDQLILGLWSNEYDANAWAYGAGRGWLRLDGNTAVTDEAMLLELSASKAVRQPVGLFEDAGAIQQIYAW
ncbi:C1 family peptidase [Dactylosporangium sp. CS-033363]|uniref:C1 family peptidase n=1 Tax=Dactylosporangium sp. CS-033363 TaxID=3239935 RepID=UPI003D8F93A9